MLYGKRFLIAILVAGIALAGAGSTAAAPTADGPNLINNPGFEGLYSKQCCHNEPGFDPNSVIDEVQVAPGWRGWWLEPGDAAHPASGGNPSWHRPEFRNANCGDPCANRIRSGAEAQKYFTFFSVHDGGMYQQVGGVVPGQRLRFSIYLQAWSTHSDYGASSGQSSMGMQIGIDPFGGTNPFSSNVVWSPVSDSYDAWALYSVEAVAKSGVVTVYTRSQPVWGFQHNDIYLDDASLVVVTGGTSVSPPPATGTVRYVAVSGDNYYRIARKFGITFAAILQANPSANPNILQIGQVLTIPGATTGGTTGGTTTTPATGTTTYLVVSGDSLWRLATRFNTTIARIKQLNGLTGDMIFIGQTLVIGP